MDKGLDKGIEGCYQHGANGIEGGDMIVNKTPIEYRCLEVFGGV